MKMTQCLVYFLVLGLFSLIRCELSLQIVKSIEDFITPVHEDVDEKAGTVFSLICELKSTGNDTDLFDENLSWVKAERNKFNHSRFITENTNTKSIASQSGINKSEKKFKPLKLEDKGTYYCVSLKFNLFKSVELRVRHDIRRVETRPFFETSFCNEQMFQCVSNGVCIIQHYVCDGVADCKDGSDESFDTCKGEPCQDKIPCDEDRCIPTSWCCDRTHDLNCTVTNRPRCCQLLSDSYEEYGFPNVIQTQHNGARYLFILVCILSILFSIVLLLLILSKVVIFAKKTALQQQRHTFCENIALRNQNEFFLECGFNGFYRVSRNPRENYNRNIILESTDVNDPLLFPPRFNTDVINDQPPSYIDVLRNNNLISEPPPPYTSREILNSDRRPC